MSGKPKVFIGSSAESLEIAEAIHYNLDYVAEVTPWSAGFFNLSSGALETLLDSLDGFDFAIFVFSPDDLITIRGRDELAPRDNVVFELGLFIGRLGRDRCFIVVPRGTEALRLPTDLVGFTPGTYEPDREDRNLKAALVYACSDVKDAIKSLGRIKPAQHQQNSKMETLEPAHADLGALDQECTAKGINLGAMISEGFLAQTYRANVNGRLAGLNIRVRSMCGLNPGRGFPAFRLRVGLHRVRDGYPSDRLGERLLSGHESDLGNFISFDGEIEQIAGEKYAIVVDYPEARVAGAHRVAHWGGSTGNLYKEGDACSSKDGVNWFITSLNDHDFHFRTYVIPS